LLYFFLAAAGDKHGLSFYSDARTSALLKIQPEALAQARGELLHRDLIAYQAPVTQVLSMPTPRLESRACEPRRIGDILRGLMERPS
jgi:hypothetical protein